MPPPAEALGVATLPPGVPARPLAILLAVGAVALLGSLAGLPGLAIVAAALLAPAALVLNRVRDWFLPALAPVLGLIGAAPAFLAVAARRERAAERAAMAGLAWAWTGIAGGLLGRALGVPLGTGDAGRLGRLGPDGDRRADLAAARPDRDRGRPDLGRRRRPARPAARRRLPRRSGGRRADLGGRDRRAARSGRRRSGPDLPARAGADRRRRLGDLGPRRPARPAPERASRASRRAAAREESFARAVPRRQPHPEGRIVRNPRNPAVGPPADGRIRAQRTARRHVRAALHGAGSQAGLP